MTQDQVEALAKSYPILSEEKVERRLERLGRMAEFYRRKAPDSQDGGAMFYGFVETLEYAILSINMYRKLTSKLAELAEGKPE